MSALLEVNGLRKAFGGHVAVDGLTFVLWPGEIVGLLGPNGSGKTTAINMISGSLLPDKGSIRIYGQEICGKKPHRIAAMGIARTFQLVRVARAALSASDWRPIRIRSCQRCCRRRRRSASRRCKITTVA